MTAHITAVASPNHGPRPEGTVVSCIVLHADASPTETATISWIRSAESKVSYHSLIGRDGSIIRFVLPTRRAWHAGKSAFRGVADVNDFSLGLCFSNDQAGEPFTELQYEVGAAEAATWLRDFPAITADRITDHATVALPAGRKHDPGPLFDKAKFLEYVQRTLDGVIEPAA